jgi:hypothetical protein
MIELNLNRRNTYTNDEYFKIIVLTKDEETSIQKSRWITGNYNKLLRHDVLRCEYKKTSLICYPRWNGEIENAETKAFEALIIFCDEEESWEKILPVVNQYYERIRAKVLVSTHDKGSEWAKEINSIFLNNPSKDHLIEVVDHLDMDEFESIESKFMDFDVDNSGTITTEEFAKIASYLGESNSSDSVRAAMLAFDKNQDGKLNLQEFISWWKLGREDTTAFTKFFDLSTYITNLRKSLFDNRKLDLNLNDEELNSSKKATKIDIDIDTQNIEEYITRVYLKAAIGESVRKEACKNYLSRYNDKMEFHSDYFIDIAIFTKSCTINGVSAKDYIESFKNDLIDKLDSTLIPGLKVFLNNFVVVRTYTSDYSVNLHIEFKYDVQELLKNAFSSYLQITHWLTNHGNNPFDLDIRYHSGKCMGDILDDGGLVKDFVENCEIKFKFNALKDKVKALAFSSASGTPYFSLLQPLFVPTNLKMKYLGKVDEYLDSKSKEMLAMKLDSLKDLVDFAKNHIPEDLRKVMSRLEIGANLIDSFYSAQIFSSHLWH